jgi:hypothetical protein
MSGGLLLYESPLERVGSAGVYCLCRPLSVCNMIKILVCVAAFAVIAMAPVNGHELAPEAAGGQPAVSLQQPLLAAIEAWLAFQFDLPSVEHHPRIELAPPASIAALRGGGGSEASSQQDIVAVYSDATQTIYLPEGWTGTTPTELSILVHELVHHVQNITGLKYACPQEREKLAYAAQERWLELFGHSLERDFGLDGFSQLVKTRCLY